MKLQVSTYRRGYGICSERRSFPAAPVSPTMSTITPPSPTATPADGPWGLFSPPTRRWTGRFSRISLPVLGSPLRDLRQASLMYYLIKETVPSLLVRTAPRWARSLSQVALPWLHSSSLMWSTWGNTHVDRIIGTSAEDWLVFPYEHISICCPHLRY